MEFVYKEDTKKIRKFKINESLSCLNTNADALTNKMTEVK